MIIMYLLFSFSVGGTERLVTDICNEMVNREDEIHLYIVNDHISNDLLSTLDKRVVVQLQGREKGKGDKLSTLFKISNYVTKNRIDVIHCNSLNAPDLLYVSRLINPRTKIIYTVHGLNQYRTLGKLKIAARNWMCKSIIGISNAVTADLITNGADKGKTICVYNGIQPSKYMISKNKIFDKSKIIIGCLARIMPSLKGQDVLIKAIPSLIEDYPNVKVVFAGGVADDQKQSYNELISYIENNDINDNVDFVGTINNVSDFLQSIDVCVIPSRQEGFGLTLIEAMSTGVPCIASDVGGLAELVRQEGVGILFEPGNSNSLADKIKNVIESFDQYKQKAIENKDRILKKYSIDKMCDSLMTVYKR